MKQQTKGQERDPLSLALFRRTMIEKRIKRHEDKIKDDQKLIKDIEKDIRKLGGL